MVRIGCLPISKRRVPILKPVFGCSVVRFGVEVRRNAAALPQGDHQFTKRNLPLFGLPFRQVPANLRVDGNARISQGNTGQNHCRTINELADDWNPDCEPEGSEPVLHTCSLGGRHWTYRSQRRLFETVTSTRLGQAVKLAALLSDGCHLATYITTLRFELTTVDVAHRVAQVAAVLKSLVCLRNLELSVFWRGDTSKLELGDQSYAFPSLLGACLEGAVGFRNWQFENIHSFTSIVAAVKHLQSLVVYDCDFMPSELTAVPPTQLDSITQLNLVRLAPDLLQWIARAQIQLTTLRVATGLYEDQYLEGRRDNRFNLSVQNIWLAVTLILASGLRRPRGEKPSSGLGRSFHPAPCNGCAKKLHIEGAADAAKKAASSAKNAVEDPVSYLVFENFGTIRGRCTYLLLVAGVLDIAGLGRGDESCNPSGKPTVAAFGNLEPESRQLQQSNRKLPSSRLLMAFEDDISARSIV
ncbi:hypothetical protein C8R47DRAFT_1255575 [Mycena vitilis]|nr:hypothetical protein C8R47DRAFT_1255575 [Mycena vitilis]